MFHPLRITPILLFAAIAFASCAKESAAPVATHKADATAKVAAKKAASAKHAEPANSNTVQAGGSDTIHDLAPKNTVFWLEIESFDALVKTFDETVGDALKGANGPTDPESALAFLQLMGLPSNKLQRDQPLAVALSLELGSKEPTFTLLLPMADAKATAAKIKETAGQMNVVAKGRFLAISNTSSYRPDISLGSTLGSVRGNGLLGMHVETARIVDRFEQELEMGLQGMLAQGAADAQGNKARAAGNQMGFATLSALSKGLKTMSFQLDVADGQLSMQAKTTLRAGSRLTEFGQDEASDLREMLRYVNYTNDELVLGTAHKAAIAFLADPLVALYDEHAATTGAEKITGNLQQFMGMLTGDSVDVALTGNLAERETDMALFINGLQSAQWVALAERLVETRLFNMGELTLLPPRKGQDENSRFAQYDLVAQAQSEAAEELEQLLGRPRARLRFLGKGDEIMMTLGEGRHFQNRDHVGTGELPANLGWALEQVKGASPAMVSRVHATHEYLDRRAFALLTGEEPAPVAQSTPETTAWATTYMAFGSTEWRMGFRMDLEAFGQQLDRATRMQPVAIAGN